MLKRSFLFVFLLSACAYHGNKSHNLSAEENYQKVPSGRIHRSCLDKFGMKIVQIIDDSTQRGMSCLASLPGEGARKNHANLKKLFESQKISYHCNEADYNWKGIAAHASLGTEWNKEKYGLIHPYVPVFPDYVLSDSSVRGKVLPETLVQNVMFHEYFHFIGYLHNRSVEYPYACEECCMESQGLMDSEYKNLSCKICMKDYADISDPHYLRDFWSWQKKTQWKSIHWQAVTRRAVFRSNDRAKIWGYFFKERKKTDISYKYLAGLIKALPESHNIPEINMAAGFKDSSVDEGIIKLAQEVAVLEKNLLVDHNVLSAAKGFQQLDTKALKLFLRLHPQKNTNEYKSAESLWDNILYDIEFLYDEIEKTDKKYALEFWELHREIRDIKP